MNNRISKNTIVSSGVALSSIPAVCKAYTFVKCASSKNRSGKYYFAKCSSGSRGGEPCARMRKQSVTVGVKFLLIHLTWRFFFFNWSILFYFLGVTSSLLLCSAVLSFGTDGG